MNNKNFIRNITLHDKNGTSFLSTKIISADKINDATAINIFNTLKKEYPDTDMIVVHSSNENSTNEQANISNTPDKNFVIEYTLLNIIGIKITSIGYIPSYEVNEAEAITSAVSYLKVTYPHIAVIVIDNCKEGCLSPKRTNFIMEYILFDRDKNEIRSGTFKSRYREYKEGFAEEAISYLKVRYPEAQSMKIRDIKEIISTNNKVVRLLNGKNFIIDYTLFDKNDEIIRTGIIKARYKPSWLHAFNGASDYLRSVYPATARVSSTSCQEEKPVPQPRHSVNITVSIESVSQ